MIAFRLVITYAVVEMTDLLLPEKHTGIFFLWEIKKDSPSGRNFCLERVFGFSVGVVRTGLPDSVRLVFAVEPPQVPLLYRRHRPEKYGNEQERNAKPRGLFYPAGAIATDQQ